MESVFRREVDYLMEGIYLLQHLGAGRKYRELKEEIDRRFGNPLREGLCAERRNFRRLLHMERI